MRAAAERRGWRGVLDPPWVLLLLAIACVAVYANGLHGSFQFDDHNVIVDNSAVHGASAWWDAMPGIRPLLKLSYALNWAVTPQAWAFRAFNIALHALNSVLVWALLRGLLARSSAQAAEAPAVALLAALVFALHPAQTEAVTYVSGRSVSLMASFYLASLCTFMLRERSVTARVASPLLFACALAVKETAWTLPFALVLVAHGFEARSLREALRTTRAHWLALALAAVAALSLARYRDLLDTSIATRTLKENLLTQIDGVSYLLTQPLLWLATNIDPDLPLHHALTPGLAVKAALLLGLLSAAVWLSRRRAVAGFALLWLFLHLAPTNSLLPRLDVANDRQLYLALVGPALLFGMLAARPMRIHALPAALASAVVLSVLASATLLRNRDYATEVSLWQATAQASPSKARAWNNLGYAYKLAGRRDEARAAFERAIALDPEAIKARHNLDALER